jgi:hypothetical protein
MISVEKYDAKQIKATKQVTTSAESLHTIKSLREQKAAIIKQRDDFVAARNAEIAEVQEMIDKARALNVTEEVDLADPK